MILVERYSLSRPGCTVRIGKAKDQRARAIVMNCTHLVLVIPMNVSIKHSDVVVGGENVHDLIAIAGEPFPVRTEIEQWTVCENDDRRSLRETGQIFFQPRQLFSANFRLGAGNVVERHEMDAAVIERVERLAKDFTI